MLGACNQLNHNKGREVVVQVAASRYQQLEVLVTGVFPGRRHDTRTRTIRAYSCS